MPYSLDDKLVVAVSSRALFDLQAEHTLFESKGVVEFERWQIAHQDEAPKPGVAFHLVQQLLRVNDVARERAAAERAKARAAQGADGDGEEEEEEEDLDEDGQSDLVEVVVVSRNSPTVARRVRNAVSKYGLRSVRSSFTSGASVAAYIAAYRCDLFLSAHEEDVREALASGIAAAVVRQPPADTPSLEPPRPMDALRIAIDGDACLFDDDSERVYVAERLRGFLAHEVAKQDVPMGSGPIHRFVEGLGRLQARLGDDADRVIRLALFTARSAPADMRVLNSLQHYGIHLAEAHFLGGMDKTPFLRAFRPQLFLDDGPEHVMRASAAVPSAHVPFGVKNMQRVNKVAAASASRRLALVPEAGADAAGGGASGKKREADDDDVGRSSSSSAGGGRSSKRRR